ncbi:hypothetical protein [Streptomyces hydrogenans]|uniref:hypothetical protein n=1 Tax=Streptomyces hydrogenans TaxID=1873719 RepID=UPI00344178D2
MTQISKGEDLPAPERAERSGPVPLDIPHGAVGKSSGTRTGPGAGTGSGAGPGDGAARGPGTGSAADGGPAGSPGEDRARPPRRVDGAAGGWWTELIAPSPAPAPGTAAAAGTLGGEFDDIVYAGGGDARFAMEETVPPGYVLVDSAWTGDSFDLDSIDWDGRDAVSLGGAFRHHRFERRVMWCDNLYPLRFRVRCGDLDEWVIVIRSVRGVRELGTGTTGRDSEVLLHTGPAGELVSRLRPTKGEDSLDVRAHRPRRPGAPATYPSALALSNGRDPRDRRELPEGPLLVEVTEGAGEWSLEVHEPRPPEEKRPGFWGRLFGR